MARQYKTPGVYVEEIPKFPPSVAAVETAIPAFIGYTEKALRGGESLTNKPTRIESIADYEAWFGSAPSQNVTLELDSNNRYVSGSANAKLYLYDSLRLFYANGGGNCYIVSVGDYSSSVASSDLEAGLALLEQVDEPTILLSPDAVSAAAGPYEFNKKALEQCNKLMDRVALCDLEKATTNLEFVSKVDAFRNGIGINYLKYGTAYGPWVKANLPRTLKRRNVQLQRGGNPIDLSSLTSDPTLLSLISDLLSAESFVDQAVSIKTSLTGSSSKSFEDKLKELQDAFNALAADASRNTVQSAVQAVANLTVDIVKNINDRYSAAPLAASSNFKLKDDIDNYLSSAGIIGTFETLANHHLYVSRTPAAADRITVLTAGASLDSAAALLGFTNSTTLLPDPIAPPERATLVSGAIAGEYAGATTHKQRGQVAVNAAVAACNDAIAFFSFLESTQTNYEKILNDALLSSFGSYKELVDKAGETLNLLPPSGAIAGVYAAVDRDRGVWKAPANVSLNAISAPAVTITHEQQEGYNVDANSGKSINIIRSFTGKGTLVWGARTLAGNDNEWRYISVRRFFNFVEESVKKATEQFVFEPNDANTWVKLQAMIENFLTTLWRQGALQGIKPEHAFYVAVGLGKTMTALDILEGRLVIEIGMAAVRPAEFIILKFSHKMAES